MPARFVNLDRQTPMLLPCDLRDWVPADHLVHFILDAVEELPLSHFHVNHRGTGSEQYPPAMMLAPEVTAILADSGFYSEAAVRAVEQTPAGTSTGMTVYAAVEKHSHHKTVADLLPLPEPAAPGPQASVQEVMAHRLRTAAGQALYKLRKQTVEPVFGIIKAVMGFRQFQLRGRAKVELEWTLVCVSYNLKRMFGLKNLMTTG